MNSLRFPVQDRGLNVVADFAGSDCAARKLACSTDIDFDAPATGTLRAGRQRQ